MLSKISFPFEQTKLRVAVMIPTRLLCTWFTVIFYTSLSATLTWLSRLCWVIFWCWKLDDKLCRAVIDDISCIILMIRFHIFGVTHRNVSAISMTENSVNSTASEHYAQRCESLGRNHDPCESTGGLNVIFLSRQVTDLANKDRNTINTTQPHTDFGSRNQELFSTNSLQSAISHKPINWTKHWYRYKSNKTTDDSQPNTTWYLKQCLYVPVVLFDLCDHCDQAKHVLVWATTEVMNWISLNYSPVITTGSHCIYQCSSDHASMNPYERAEIVINVHFHTSGAEEWSSALLWIKPILLITICKEEYSI